MIRIAVDAMGGDHAPDSIVAGAKAAAAAGTPVVLVGPSNLADLTDIGDLPLIEASEVIEMDEDGGRAVRRKKDSTLVRAAEAVRDGHASAMISAGNTGATMASALLRMGRIRGVNRPAIATIIPYPGGRPTVEGPGQHCPPELAMLRPLRTRSSVRHDVHVVAAFRSDAGLPYDNWSIPGLR